MIERVYRRLTEGGRPCVVSVRLAADAALLNLSSAAIATDEFGDAGPLGGLVSAAAAVRTSLLFAAAGDLPNIESTFIDTLEREFDRRCELGEAPHAIVPVWPDGKLEPLAALYDTAALLAGGKTALAVGKRKVLAALEGARVARYAVRAEDEAMLANVNTPEDYATHVARRSGFEGR